MNPSDILKSEHRVIEQVLACLEKMSEECQQQGRLDRDPAREAVDFFRNFADGCHHGKEEEHYFPAMEAAGFPRQGGPTGVMIHEHEVGRRHIREMDATIDAAAEGRAEAVDRFVSHARDYVALLREHIAKEDHCLFTMADQALSADEQAALLSAFDRVETHEMGEGTHQRYLDLANELAGRYGVAAVEAHGGCCGHH